MERANKTSPKPLGESLKAITTVAVIALVALAAGGPRLFKGGIEETPASASSGAPATASPAAATTSDVYYFPSGFEAPKGEVATIPDTF
jgi:hypothetical protein